METAARATELHKKAAESIKHNPQMQDAIRRLTERVCKNAESMAALLGAQAAAMKAASSGTYGEFRKAQQELYEQYRKMGIASAQKEYFLPEIKIDSNIPDSDPVPVQNREQANEIYGKLDCIKSSIDDVSEGIDDFWANLKNMVDRNETASSENAKASMKISKLAIIISVLGILASGGIQWYFACRTEKNDRTGELIEVIKQSHPWSKQQISEEDAKNVRVAFQAITGALQKNMQLEKDNIQFRQETACLEVNLKKAQDTLSGLEKKYNVATAGFALEKQKLYAEIAALKKQIEELKVELAKRLVQQSESRQEAKNE